jgi:23S rRNA pseudouridine1911/1915/1917 synthase
LTSFHYKIQTDGMTVESLLRDQWQAGKKTVHLMRMAKSVTDLEEKPVDWKEPQQSGTTLVIDFPEAVSSYVSSENNPNSIVYEDEHFLAAVKPAGMATHPDGPGETGTFMNQVIAYVREQGGVYAEHVHRLDQGTAGIILVAKHPIAKTIFDRMIENNEITRTYEAEVDGDVKRPKGVIRLSIGRDRHHPTRRRVSLSGQSAVTHFKVLERKEASTIIEAELETGRTHQIRVHFAHIGHPVTGDTLYGGSETNNGQYRLVAKSVTFNHPFTGEAITIEQ